MHKHLVLVMVFIAALFSTGVAANASPSETYAGTYYGDGNFPPGCIRDRARDNPANICFHAKTGLNALDSPQIDVAVLVPASPTAERDLRIMRQAAEAWEGGIDYLSGEMGLDWLRDGVDFHITPSVVSLTEGDEVSTFPLYDPEIVIIATNPAGGAGIGVDPMYLGAELGIFDENGVPCHNIPNPFSLETWEGMPGYDGHHGDSGGIYVEDCGGAGGNVCFSVNGGVDPVPGVTDTFSLFDLVLHETGHCLTLGHVGDGAETPAWGPVPTTDIMAYSYDPPGINKCVSTLNVEAFALRMSQYVDRNGDGAVTQADWLEPNDLPGDGANSFQVQHPDDHLFASSTGSVWDCPQADLGTLPGERTDWTPDPVATTSTYLTVTSPSHGAESADGSFQVTGTVERSPIDAPPTSPTASAEDTRGDALSDLGDIQQVDVSVSDLEVTAVVKVAQLWPSTTGVSLAQYGIAIDGREIDSFIDPSSPAEVTTWDHSMETRLPTGWSQWDPSSNTVTFHIPRSYLAAAKATAPYDVFALSGYVAPTKNWTLVADDRAPDSGMIGVAGPPTTPTTSTSTSGGVTGTGAHGTGSLADPLVLEHQGGNTFTVANTSLGLTTTGRHQFTLNVPQSSNVDLKLAWPIDGSDLDLYVTGAGTGSSASSGNPEDVRLSNVQGTLSIAVDPYLITGIPSTTYTLTATVTPTAVDTDGDGVNDGVDQCRTVAGPAPSGCPDADADGTPDSTDQCPNTWGVPPTGCPAPAIEHVTVYVDGVQAASQDVDSRQGPDAFSIPVTVPVGSHELKTVWDRKGTVIATDVRTVVHSAPGVDRDGDTVADSRDNCVKTPNTDQKDLDHDGIGDACDNDIDGDGYNNAKERAAGTDPYDPTSYPRRKSTVTGL